MSFSKLAFASVFAMSLFGGAAQAGTVYTNQSAFQAQNPGLSLETFSSCGPFSVCGVPSYSGFTVSGIYPQVVGANVIGNASSYLIDDAFGGFLNLSFTSPVNTIGFNLAQYYSGIGNLTVQLFNGATLLDTETVAVTGVDDFSSFVGFSGFGTLSSVRIAVTNGGQFVNIDNLSYGNTSNVPEPASLALLGLGLAGLAASRRKAKQA